MSDLKARVAARFIAVNGTHEMTAADDAYVSEYFLTLEDLCAARSMSCDEVRAHMLARRLPLPGYLRSDGTEMVPSDLLDLADQAGGIEQLGEWFIAHWPDRRLGEDEWNSYLDGQYVCLASVTPANIMRKDELVAAIELALADPLPQSGPWTEHLHSLVDELDELETPFAPYDRLRAGGPVSRDTVIDAVRARYPRRPAGR